MTLYHQLYEDKKDPENTAVMKQQIRYSKGHEEIPWNMKLSKLTWEEIENLNRPITSY